MTLRWHRDSSCPGATSCEIHTPQTLFFPFLSLYNRLPRLLLLVKLSSVICHSHTPSGSRLLSSSLSVVRLRSARTFSSSSSATYLFLVSLLSLQTCSKPLYVFDTVLSCLLDLSKSASTPADVVLFFQALSCWLQSSLQHPLFS